LHDDAGELTPIAQIIGNPIGPATLPGDRSSQVLVISSPDDFGQRLSAALRSLGGSDDSLTHVTRVDGYLHALGHIGRHGAADLILGRCKGLEAAPRATVSALRGMAPRARMVLLVGTGERSIAAQAADAGFDAQIDEEQDDAHLEQALADALELHADGPSVPIGDSTPSSAEEPPDGVLGDVDLIERMLVGRRSIRELAMTIIDRESDMEGLAWASQRKDVPAGHRAAEVIFEQARSGFLHGPKDVDAQRLASWAGWLGRWLAMEQRMEHLWRMAMHDELTGMWNRRYFNRFLEAILERAARERFNVTLLIFDIDDFKTYNDLYGHGAGDDILCETARLMESVVRKHDVVARIGGDEFAVIFWDAEAPRRPDSEHPHDVVLAARRFQRAICDHRFPKLEDVPITMSISGGLAGFPWDGRTPEELIEAADRMALQSKKQGKNALTLGPGAERVCRVNLVRPDAGEV
jgi:two-component system cell cycle response regulator